jgi:dihydroflavonol-4-reductase
MKKVGIIGGSGFIGSYVTKQFLANGYEVKVSATDISKTEKYKHLMTFDETDRLHISELNVENKDALRDFVQDCDIVIHGGTPFQLAVEDAQRDLYDPTIKGTENFLEVISETPLVKKVVIVASVAAYNTNFPMPAEGKSAIDSYDENDKKCMLDDSIPYARAKFIANQVVENFIDTHPDLDFEITSVSPVGVMGKSLSAREDSTSTGFQYLLKNKLAPDAFFQMLYDTDVELALVDVADVADAIYKAATTLGLHGKNYLLSSASYPISDITLMLNLENPKTEGTIIYQNALAKRDLAMSFRPVKETLVAYSS